MAKLICEAHLPAGRRSLGLVSFVRGRRRSLTRWLIFLGLVLINEMRGAAVAAEFLKTFLA